VTSSVGTVEQLSLAIQHANQLIDQHIKGDVVAKFACASYLNGSDISAWARSNTQMWMSPMYVSIEDDLLCFIVRANQLAPEIRVKLSFMVTLPDQLKLEPNVLELIDYLSEDPNQSYMAAIDSLFSSADEDNDKYRDVDLVISYYSNSTTIFAKSGADGATITVEDHSQRSESSSRHLLSYATSSLSNFYWTESSSEGQDFNNSVSMNIDLWNKFADILGSQSSSSSWQDDPCGFRDLNSFDMEGDTIVPLDSLLTSCNREQVGACFAFLVSEFASDPLVAHISLATRPVWLNYRARSIQQFGKVGTSDAENPFTAAGLKGSNQVVGVTDTGLDDRSCYFIDSSESSDIKRSVVSKPFTDSSRRKVVQYSHLKEADTEDLTAGHGTHVAGTVAGYNEKPLSEGGKYSGVAPNAKIAFVDIATSSGQLYIPPVTQLYSALKQAKAFVCSNSWGGRFPKSGGFYAGSKVDNYLYKNMDTLILFANGNSGLEGKQSITREASGKNVVAVG